MYKVTIEDVVGEIRKVVTVETDDVELIKLVLSKQEVTSVHSDVDNLNIDPEWQDLLQWNREYKRIMEPYPVDHSLFTVTC